MIGPQPPKSTSARRRAQDQLTPKDLLLIVDARASVLLLARRQSPKLQYTLAVLLDRVSVTTGGMCKITIMVEDLIVLELVR